MSCNKMQTDRLIFAATLLSSFTFTLSFALFRYIDKIFEPSVAKPAARIFERYVPGYDVISEFSTDILGVKPDFFLSIGLFLYVTRKTISIASEGIATLISRYFLSRVTIEGHDNLHSCVLDWLLEQRTVETSRSLLVMTNLLGPWGFWNRVGSNIDLNLDFDLSDCELRVPPTYAPNYGTYLHWHLGRPFWISRSQSPPLLWSSSEDMMLLTCIGRFIELIKNLIQHCRKRDHEKHKGCTKIYRSLNKNRRIMNRS